MIEIGDAAHHHRDEDQSGEPSRAPGIPRSWLFHYAGGEAQTTACHRYSAYEFDVPRHQVQVALAPNLAPKGENHKQCNQKLEAIRQTQPGWAGSCRNILRRRRFDDSNCCRLWQRFGGLRYFKSFVHYHNSTYHVLSCKLNHGSDNPQTYGLKGLPDLLGNHDFWRPPG